MSAEGRGRDRGRGSRSGTDTVLGSPTGAAILAGLAVACHTLMFPPFGLDSLAWVAPLPLLLLGLWCPRRSVILAGWAIGTLQALLINGLWLLPAIRSVFDLSWLAAGGLLLLEAQIVGGIPFAVLALLLRVGARLPPAAFVLYAPAAWVAVEYGRGHSPLAAPWALLGSALSEQALPIQVADLGGVYAVSFVAVLPSAAIAALLVSHRDRRTLAAAATAAALVAAALGYGAFRLRSLEAEMRDAPTLRIALVHAELVDAERLSAAWAPHNVDRYLALGPPAGAAIDVVVWPENTVGVLLEDNPELVARIAARAAQTPYLIGGPRLVEAMPRSLRASAFLIGAHGIEATYDKRRLLPAAETWGGGWGALLGFGAGADGVPFDVRGTHIGTSICFEAVFPDLARADARAGADLLVNISNDSWFAHGAGPRLHFLLGRLRAVETRRAVARVANGGITALVLPDGRLAATADDAPGALIVAAPFLHTETVYVRIGDAFAWLCIAGVALGLAAAIRRSRLAS